ncbi:MAG: hypothetical protein WBI17_11740, partial [Clostridiaceae bacterium]
NLLELALRASSSYFSGYFFEKNADRNRKVTICMKKGLFCNSPIQVNPKSERQTNLLLTLLFNTVI